MSTALATTNDRAGIIERVMLVGDLAKISAQDRVEYYGAVCTSLGLNPLTRPFDYLQLGGRLVMYANKGCTDQLRNIHRVSVEIVRREYDEALGVYTVTARATKPNGRADEDVGSVVVANLKGEALANATMKAHTKAKRRVTMSICGLSMLDESELDSVRDARPMRVDLETGEVLGEVVSNDGMSRVKTYITAADDDPTHTYNDSARVAGHIEAIEAARTTEELLKARPYTTTDEYEAWSPEDRRALNKAYKARERKIAKLETLATAAVDPFAEDL